MKKKLIAIFASITFLVCILSSFVLPTYATSRTDEYVVDEYGVLDTENVERLNLLAKEYSEKYHINFYIRILETSGSTTIERRAEGVYNSENLGYGEDKDGLMLIMTMQDRQFDILVHGKKARGIFITPVRESIADQVINDYMRYDRYDEGARQFFDSSIKNMHTVNNVKIGIAIIIPAIIGLIVVIALCSKHKTKGISHEALSYIPSYGFNLRTSRDFFLNRTISRTYSPRSKSSSGGGGFHSSSGGGFSHTSGHF
ncbi:MAG: TPM domain-containing protein [Erysipelotrichaceae bacterium]|nr:TPM domain-containing protein [Erysipelotrichaceae bacterium]